VNTPLSDRDHDYVERVKSTYAQDAVWMIAHAGDAGDDDMILSGSVGV
jgi:hypothetical protein